MSLSNPLIYSIPLYNPLCTLSPPPFGKLSSILSFDKKERKALEKGEGEKDFPHTKKQMSLEKNNQRKKKRIEQSSQGGKK
jgi:hypothetical protein